MIVASRAKKISSSNRKLLTENYELCIPGIEKVHLWFAKNYENIHCHIVVGLIFRIGLKLVTFWLENVTWDCQRSLDVKDLLTTI